SLLLEADQRGIDRALAEALGTGQLLDAARDAVAVERAERVQGLQDEEVQRAVRELRIGVRHVSLRHVYLIRQRRPEVHGIERAAPLLADPGRSAVAGAETDAGRAGHRRAQRVARL